jgi:hypothetical protein
MHSMTLTVSQPEFVRALRTLGVLRRKRFTSRMPVWLHFLPEAGELQIVEEQGSVTAYVPAEGTWPAAGATINLFPLRKGAEDCCGPVVCLHVADDAILVSGEHTHFRMKLLEFGPASLVRRSVIPGQATVPQGVTVPDYLDLPLFRWSLQRA